MKGKREVSVDVYSPKHPAAQSASKHIVPGFLPEAWYKLVNGRSSGSFYKKRLPVLHTVASCFLLPNACSDKTYSSGDCPGIAPVFPFNAFSKREQPKTRTKVGFFRAQMHES